MPVFPSYRHQSTDLQYKIMRTRLEFNGLNEINMTNVSKKRCFPKNVVSMALNYYIQRKSTILPGIFLRRDQVNLLVYGPNRPYFGELAFFFVFIIFCFLKKEKETKLHKLHNNQNQDAFIVIVINYKLINEIILRAFFF